MEKIKNNKIKIIVVVALLIIIGVSIYLFLDNKKKEYCVTEVSNYKYYPLNENGKYGVIAISGEVIVEPIYDSVKIPNPEKDVFVCEKDEKNTVLNEKNEVILDQFEEVTAIAINGIVTNIPYEKTVLQYKKDGKYGLIDYNGKVITKPIYEEIKGLVNKESELLVKRNDKYGVINVKGATLIKEEYDEITADGFYTEDKQYALSGYITKNKTTDGYRYGYINNKLKKILDTEYNELSRILDIDDNDVYLNVCKNGQYGIIKNKKVLIPYSYQGIEYDKNNKIFEVQRNSKYGIIDINGNTIIPIEYDEIEVKGVYIQAIENGENNYFDVNGNKIESLGYTSMLKTDNDNYYITINEEGLYGIVDSQKRNLVDNKYNYLEYLFEDYFIASNENGSLGIINTNDKTMVNFIYEVLQKIDDTTIIEAKILTENKTDLYSKNLKQIYSINNALIYKKDNYIQVSSNQDSKYFDFYGKELQTSEIYKDNKLLASKKDDKWGYVDKLGNVVVDYVYDKVTEFNDYGYAGIRQGELWGIMNKEGEIIVEPTYKLEETNLEPEFLGKYYKVYYGYGESYYTNIQ